MITPLTGEQPRPALTTNRLLDTKLQPFAPVVDWVAGASKLANLWDEASRGTSDVDLFNRVLGLLNITVECSAENVKRLPEEGPLVVVANHPHGLLDGLVIASVVLRRRPDFRFLANSMLAGIPGLDQYVIPVDVFGNSGNVNRAAARNGIRWLRSGGVLITFPAGEVSSLTGLPPVIADREWSEGPIRIAAATGAKILQSFIGGSNSFAFHFAGFAHPTLKTLLLGRELLNKRGRHVNVTFGKPMSPEIAERPLANEYLRRKTWAMGQTRAVPARSTTSGMKPIAAKVDAAALQRNVEQLSPDRLLFRNGVWSAHFAPASELPHVLEEIGRLRELTFRQVGEGTGRSSDIDAFDAYYQHLFIWNSEAREIVGAYRIAAIDDVLPRFGLRGLYTSTLFRYDHDFLHRITPGLELGRSFVRPEYQRRPHSLFYLWRGIGEVLARFRRFRYLFGPVSISNDYSSATRELMTRYFRNQLRTEHWTVRPRRPYRSPSASPIGDISPWVADVDELGNVVSELEPDGKGLPVLLRQYLAMGAEIVDFNVDPEFSNALDALIIVDLSRCPRRNLAKYVGSAGALDYLDMWSEKSRL